MPELKGSMTEKNLLAAFAGESQARNRYTYFASQAKKDGYEQISFVFQETADQEKEHAKKFFNTLQGGEVEILACYPAGTVGSTVDNLKAAAAGEGHEWGTLYPQFAATARSEGFEAVARLFENVAIAEKFHGKRYADLAANIEADRVFKKEKPVTWRCRNCGYVHDGTDAPKACPACAHPQAHFEIVAINW
jgi:rubrerythrin